MKVEHETQTAPERAKPLCFRALLFSPSESLRNYQFIIRVAAEREKRERDVEYSMFTFLLDALPSKCLLIAKPDLCVALPPCAVHLAEERNIIKLHP